VKGGGGGKTYWRSLEDLAGDPALRAFAEREFPEEADALSAPSRREFLKLMGASVALAGMTACRRWPVEKIVPFAHRPEGYVPGEPVQFATAMDLAGSAIGLLVTSYDGRPIKIEGNPLHPSSLGGTDPLAQAAILELYDPDRSTTPLRFSHGQEIAVSWEEARRFVGTLFREHRERKGRGLAILSEASSSPTLLEIKRRLLEELPGARWYEWEPLSRDAAREGTALAFGKPYRSWLRLDRAERIVCLDADPLMTEPGAVRYARDFARGRRGADGTMNRLYAIEPALSITGANADHRLAVPHRMVAAVAGRIAAELFLRRGVALPPGTEDLRPALERFASHPFRPPLLEPIVEDLLAFRGRSVVLAGPGQPAEVHALVHLVNFALGNAGKTIAYAADPDPERESHARAIASLAEAIGSGGVDTLFVVGGNPAFDAPADLDLARALAEVPNTVHLSLYVNETSRASAWHLPRAHFLEGWSDARGHDGTISVVQPLIEPLYDGIGPAELLAGALGDGEAGSGYEIVRRTMRRALGEADFERRWRKLLHDGLLEGSAFEEERPVPVRPGWAGALERLADRAAPVEPGPVEIVFRGDLSIHDGRFANNGWLQELPDPITRIAWDNPALLSPSTAAELGVGTGDLVAVRAEARAVELPVFVLPGLPAGTVVLSVGYGRRSAGRVGDGVGFDVYRLRTSQALWCTEARVEPTGRRHPLATVQDHHLIDALGMKERQERAVRLIREGTLAEFVSHPAFAKEMDVHEGELPQLYRTWSYEGHKWGMAIDLSACIGCGSCTIACQAENNIPVVGKKEVARGREMHWIRVDRYFTGPAEDPEVRFQPMTCHHCENAPCEQVCPVGATLHDHEGLNVMVYNRCIGTRYCSNNCPYKVRRFNWFNNNKRLAPVEKMRFNPEVTVRSRGVMEKCTFCTQRIEAARLEAKRQGRPLEDGDITPACAQACPTEAIVFGDLNDPESRVRRLFEDPRAYGVLEEIGTRPRLKYLARLKNPAAVPTDRS